MGYRKRKKKCKTSYDRLEGRRLLAGDVLTSVDDGTLFIIGDAQSNIVQLAQDANGNVLITGNDTTVNGQSESVSISDQFSRVSIRMGDGADEVSVSDFEGGREFRFLGEGGNDRLTTNNLSSRYMHLRGDRHLCLLGQLVRITQQRPQGNRGFSLKQPWLGWCQLRLHQLPWRVLTPPKIWILAQGK